MSFETEEDLFGDYVDSMLESVKSTQYNKKTLRTAILQEILINRRKIQGSTSQKTIIEEAEIRMKAEEIASWENSYDTLVWLWAESSLELKTGSKPDAETIICVAEKFAVMEKDIQKIHWYLAENLVKLHKQQKK